jgi:hypothetical protein
MMTQVSALLEKEVSRKEFLTMSGLALASVMGFGSVIKLLTGKSVQHFGATTSPQLMNSAYSGGAYGGFKK